jgi:hypothetical protein
MRIITIIILLFFTIACYSQVEYQPEVIFPQNQFGFPVRDTTGTGRTGEHRVRPQDGRTYFWVDAISAWVRYIDVRDTANFAATAYTGTAPISVSGNVISMTAASNSADGYITTGTQNIAGLKTFTAAGINIQPSSTNTAAYTQINNTGGNFQFILTPSSGYSDYGIFTENVGGLYTNGSSGMAFLSDGTGTPGAFKFAFGTNTTPAFEINTTNIKIPGLGGSGSGVVGIDNSGNLSFTTAASSQWSTITSNSIKYTGSSSHSIVTVASPATSTAALFSAASFDGVDARLQSNAASAFIGTVTNHPFSIIANNVTAINFPAAGGIETPNVPRNASTTDSSLYLDPASGAWQYRKINTGAGYSVYTALLSQSGTSDPTAIVLGNNTIGAIVWTRNSTGSYTGTLTGAFTSNKTWLICQKGDGSGSFVNGLLFRSSANALSLDVRDNTNTVTDGFTNLSIEIRVYP